MAPKLKLPRMTNGIWEPLWKNHAKVIEQFVKAEKLQPAKVAITANEIALKFNPKRFPGIPVPHLHLGDKMYALTDQQWKGFTSQLNKDMMTKLAEVKPVDIAHIADISNAIYGKTR
jgi:hypothetical protein